MQCGEPGTWGSALCLSTSDMPSHCNSPPPGEDAFQGCLVGDVMHQDGDSVGFLGSTCTGRSTYQGTESFCRDSKVQFPQTSVAPRFQWAKGMERTSRSPTTSGTGQGEFTWESPNPPRPF